MRSQSIVTEIYNFLVSKLRFECVGMETRSRDVDSNRTSAARRPRV